MDTKQAEYELTIIRKIMDDSRKAIVDNGWHYIYWGVTVTLVLIVNYLMIIYDFSMNKQGMLWFISMISAAIIESVIERVKEKKVKVKTFAGKILNSLWSASGICMFMLGFLGTISGAYSPIYIFPLISIVLGLAYYISGIIQQIKWLQLISFFWWAGSAVLFFLPGIHSLLIFAGMIISFQVIPGILIYIKSVNESKLQSI